MSDITHAGPSQRPKPRRADLFFANENKHSMAAPSGGARRDRTDDLLRAKQALSQLSYGPFRKSGIGYRQLEFSGASYLIVDS